MISAFTTVWNYVSFKKIPKLLDQVRSGENTLWCRYVLTFRWCHVAFVAIIPCAALLEGRCASRVSRPCLLHGVRGSLS